MSKNRLEEIVNSNPKYAERFWSHVDKKEPDECWLWNTEIKRSYGWFKITIKGKRHEFIASRVAMFLSGGDIKDKLVLHSCDTPSCCNPNHLRTGTHQENMNDMKARGRARGGRPKMHKEVENKTDKNPLLVSFT